MFYRNYGIFGNYLLNSQLEVFGYLPDLPLGYTLWNVNNDKDIDVINNVMKIRNSEIDAKYPEESSGSLITMGSCPYEDECFLVMLWFNNIFDYWFGKKNIKYKSTPKVDAYYDHLCMNIWRWIRDEINTKELKETALDFYNIAIEIGGETE